MSYTVHERTWMTAEGLCGPSAARAPIGRALCVIRSGVFMCPYRMFIVFCAAIGAILMGYLALQDPADAEAREDRERQEVPCPLGLGNNML